MPLKKKKSATRNPFFCFMEELRQKPGNANKSIPEMVEYADTFWKKMNDNEKLKYRQMAKCEKASIVTSEGISVAAIEKQNQEEVARMEDMRNDVDNIVSIAAKNGYLDTELFFIIHMNMFCFYNQTNKFIPAEIGVAAFNLRDGVSPESVFHRIIKPGPLPLGYASEALLHANSTHQLNPPKFDDVEENIKEVFFDLLIFLKNRAPNTRLPYLYAAEKDVKKIQDVLFDWTDAFPDYGEDLKVFNLQHLFRIVKNSVANEIVWPTDAISNREIEKDTYSHSSGIACDYHEATITQYCSRSIAVRYAFIICSNCCSDLNILPMPGYHYPLTTAKIITGTSFSRSTTSKSGRSSSASSTTDRFESESNRSFVTSDQWETESVSSDVSQLAVSLENFPMLGNSNGKAAGYNKFVPLDSSSDAGSNCTQKSYAAGVGRSSGNSSRASQLANSQKSDSEESQSSVITRGTTPQNQRHNFDNNINNFPALGRIRGRGRRQ